MNFRPLFGVALLLGAAAIIAAPVLAGAPANLPAATAAIAPAASPAPATAVPDDCARADALVSGRLQPAMTDNRHLPVGMTLGDALAQLYKARAFCKEGAAERGMLVYIRLSDALADPTAAKQR